MVILIPIVIVITAITLLALQNTMQVNAAVQGGAPYAMSRLLIWSLHNHAIPVNNMLYEMTGGQVVPTTPMEAITHTIPYGNPEPPLDACKLAVSFGATYVARWAVPLANNVFNTIKKLLLHQGFGLVNSN